MYIDLYRCMDSFFIIVCNVLLSLFLYSNCSQIGQWEPLQAGSCAPSACPHHSLSIYVLSDTKRYSRLILYFICHCRLLSPILPGLGSWLHYLLDWSWLGKALNLPVPQFPNLWNGNKNNDYLWNSCEN